MTPIEAMARAIHAEDLCDELAGRIYEQDKWFWDKLARAALVALRDCGVTDLMLSEAQEYEPITRIEAEHVMRAMLDAAIEEKDS